MTNENSLNIPLLFVLPPNHPKQRPSARWPLSSQASAFIRTWSLARRLPAFSRMASPTVSRNNSGRIFLWSIARLVRGANGLRARAMRTTRKRNENERSRCIRRTEVGDCSMNNVHNRHINSLGIHNYEFIRIIMNLILETFQLGTPISDLTKGSQRSHNLSNQNSLLRRPR